MIKKENLGQGRKIVVLKGSRVANEAYLERFGDYVTMVDCKSEDHPLVPLAGLLFQGINVEEDGVGGWDWIFNVAAKVQTEWESQKRPPLLKKEGSDHSVSEEIRSVLGTPPENWHVTFHVREGNDDWGSRNTSIESYRDAIRLIYEKGGVVIRIGKNTGATLREPGFYDYSQHSQRTDAGEISLVATSRFFLGTNCGPWLLPSAFGVPCALTNYHPLGPAPWFHANRFIPKLILSQKKQRLLQVTEMLEEPFVITESLKRLQEENCVLIENHPKEITQLVQELIDRTEPGYPGDEIFTPFQKRFREIMVGFRGSPASSLGEAFLSEYGEKILP